MLRWPRLIIVTWITTFALIAGLWIASVFVPRSLQYATGSPSGLVVTITSSHHALEFGRLTGGTSPRGVSMLIVKIAGDPGGLPMPEAIPVSDAGGGEGTLYVLPYWLMLLVLTPVFYGVCIFATTRQRTAAGKDQLAD